MQRLSLIFPVLVRTERQFHDVSSNSTSLIVSGVRSVIYIYFFYVLLTVHLSIILVTDQLNAQILVS